MSAPTLYDIWGEKLTIKQIQEKYLPYYSVNTIKSRLRLLNDGVPLERILGTPKNKKKV